MPLIEAERWARDLQGQVARGGDPVAEERAARAASANTVRAICAEFLAREGDKMRTADERERIFERYILPVWGARPIHEIRRSEIVRLLDKIEDENGASMSHVVLRAFARLCNWHAARDDDFLSPVVRGMGRISAKAQQRTRVLTDDEIRAVWRTNGSVFSEYLKFLLLTAARRTEAAEMRWSEIEGADWILPASRNKTGNELARPLSKAALEILAKRPRDSQWVFTNDGRKPVTGFALLKKSFDKHCGVTNWKLHDLRRTARSFMSRAGVQSDHAERCLGHVIGGVRAVYDRHQYRGEMLQAYEALAALLDRIVNPEERVVPLRGGKR